MCDELSERFTVKRIGVFGSCARGEADSDSDVDIIVELEEPTFDHYMDLKFRLEDVLDRPVDLVMAETIKPRIRPIIEQETVYGRVKTFKLKDGRIFRMGSEPDIGIYRAGKIQIAVEIKGGIDTSGAFERFGAALKSLRRAKQENENSTTVLIMQRISLTPQAKREISISRSVIDHFFALEDILTDSKARDCLFEIYHFRCHAGVR